MTRADMEQLIEAVEAGEDTYHHHARAFPSENAYGHCTWHYSHKASREGDLNAAMKLVEALQPEEEWILWKSDGNGYGCNVAGLDTEYAQTPARALLLAVLKAKLGEIA